MPDPSAVAQAVPTPTLLEWGKIILPTLLNAGVVSVAALLAYRYADRGRREDILYKEEFKAAQEVIGHLYKVKEYTRELMNAINGISKQREESSILLERLHDELLRVIQEMDYKYTVLLREFVRQEVFEVDSEVKSLLTTIRIALLSDGMPESAFIKHENLPPGARTNEVKPIVSSMLMRDINTRAMSIYVTIDSIVAKIYSSIKVNQRR